MNPAALHDDLEASFETMQQNRKLWLAIDEAIHRDLGRTGVRIAVLLMDGELPMTKVADALNLSTAAITGQIDRGEKLGWFKRTPSKGDRRVINVDLESSAYEILSEAFTKGGTP